MKWLLQNARQRATFAMKNPRHTLGAMSRELTLASEKLLAQITGALRWKRFGIPRRADFIA